LGLTDTVIHDKDCSDHQEICPLSTSMQDPVGIPAVGTSGNRNQMLSIDQLSLRGNRKEDVCRISALTDMQLIKGERNRLMEIK
jgi:hypothetical protein